MSQPGLFDRSASLNVVSDLKAAMNSAARSSDLSREQIVDEMNAQGRRYGVNLRLGLATLEKWLNPAESSHIPNIQALVIYCAILNDLTPLNILAAPLGGRVITGREITKLAWAEAALARKKANKRIRRLEEQLI